MPTLCPKCGRVIPESDVNVGKDVAFCRACDKACALSDLVREGVPAGPVDLSRPPGGAWYRDEGGEVCVGAKTRSIAGAAFMIVFTCFWNGVTWTILIMSLRGFLHQGQHAANSNTAGNVVGIGAILFMIPFVLIGLLTACLAFMMLFGRVEVRVRGSEGTVFTGVGPVGWTKRFDAAAVTGVVVRFAGWSQGNRYNSQPQYAIYLEGASPVKFGSMLSAERREFVAAALQKVLG